MGKGIEYLENPDFADFEPRTLVPAGWAFRTHDASAPTRERWLSHYRIGSEERAGLGVLAPARAAAGGVVGEAVGQWLSLPPHEPRPCLTLGLGLVAPAEGQLCYGDFRVLVESESGSVQEFFWGRLDNTLWRDLTLSLARFSGQTVRILIENLADAVLLVDYARVGAPVESSSRWQTGGLTVEVLRADPFLVEADALVNEISQSGDGSNRLLALEGDRWLSTLAGRAPFAFGDFVATDKPLYVKTEQALHVVTLTEHASMRLSILHRAIDDCLRVVRREGIASLVTAPLLLGTRDLEEAGQFARELIRQLLEWFHTFRPRRFRRFTVATLYEPLELHDLYCGVFGEAFGAAATGAGPYLDEDVIRLAGLANVVKTHLASALADRETLEYLEELLDAFASCAGAARETLGRVLEEAGLSERQMLGLLTASYRHDGRLDPRAMRAYERLHELEPGNVENTKAMASAYRSRFLLDGERTRAVYEQVFRADPGDDENNRFLAAHYIMAGAREGGSLATLVFSRVGLGADASSGRLPRAAPHPDRPMPPGEPFVHPSLRAETPGAPAQQAQPPELEGAPGLSEPASAPAPGPAAREPAAAQVSSESPGAELQPPEPELGVGWQSLEPAQAPPASGEAELTDTDQLLQRLAAEVQRARGEDV